MYQTAVLNVDLADVWEGERGRKIAFARSPGAMKSPWSSRPPRTSGQHHLLSRKPDGQHSSRIHHRLHRTDQIFPASRWPMIWSDLSRTTKS